MSNKTILNVCLDGDRSVGIQDQILKLEFHMTLSKLDKRATKDILIPAFRELAESYGLCGVNMWFDNECADCGRELPCQIHS